MLPLYSRVRLLVDRYQGEGADVGAFGYIIEVYPEGNYEVEFSDSEGITYAQLVVTEQEIASSSSEEKSLPRAEPRPSRAETGRAETAADVRCQGNISTRGLNHQNKACGGDDVVISDRR